MSPASPQPGLRVDRAGHRIDHDVDIRGDAQAEHLDVVAGVGDDGDLGRVHDLDHALEKAGCADAAGKHGNHSRSFGQRAAKPPLPISPIALRLANRFWPMMTWAQFYIQFVRDSSHFRRVLVTSCGLGVGSPDGLFVCQDDARRLADERIAKDVCRTEWHLRQRSLRDGCHGEQAAFCISESTKSDSSVFPMSRPRMCR